ncbi:MAG: CDP-glycerol glycerophosphotransferase family protein, partial [Gammaproteobacteria bacterium]
MIVTLQGVVGALLRPLQFLLYGLAGLFARDPRRWVFGSWSGHRFGDNAAALFQHVTREDVIVATWITHERALVAMLRARGLRAHLAWSPAGVWACLRAGVFVFDGLTKDINHWLSRGARRVLLRHGVGIKKIERGIEQPSHRLYRLFHGTLWQRVFWSLLLPWHRVRPDLVIASSPDHARQGQLYYGVGPERLAITGLPRNDQVLAPGPAPWGADNLEWIARMRRDGRRVWLYLPTFRDNRGLPFSWEALDSVARASGTALLVKLHYVDAARGFRPAGDGGSHLRVLDPALNPNLLFRDVDGLVSDYSSVAYDFMLTRKPVVFFVPDLEAYGQERGFYYPFEEVTPGPRPRTLAALGEALGALATAP